MLVAEDISYIARPVIFLELNELCPPILERMMAKGELPHFKKLHARSDVHYTWTDDEDLEPWVQWVTLHTGKKQEIHGAKELDEGYRVALPRVWDMMGDKGISSLIFGSMNSSATSNNVFLVPDAWSVRVRPSDPAYNAFHQFISFFVTEHTNAKAKPNKKMAIAFMRFVLTHGLSFSTGLAAIKQLLNEKFGHGCDVKWRRALILDLLMWDVFENEYKRRKPQFATFFANSTAFLQHRYWRHMQPEAYQVKPNAQEMASFGDAIESSYRHMDSLVARAMKLAGSQGRIVFATALSQEANLRYEDIGGKFVYRAHGFPALNRWAGGPEGITFEPVMTHQAWASCQSVDDAIAFEKTLDSIQNNGQTIMEWRRADARVMFWVRFISKVDDNMEITATQTGNKTRFGDLFALVGQVNNSQHNRTGAFWVERDDAQGQVHPEKLPLEQTTAQLLSLFGLSSTAAPSLSRAS